MKIKAVKYFEKGFHAQGFAFGGEDGMEHFDNNVKYRASLQNYVIDTGDDVILVDTGLPKETPGAVWDGKAHSYMGRWIEDYISALKTAGYEPSQVTKIILTHKHSDHSGEIRSFPNAKFYVNRVELDTDEVRALKDHPGITPVDFTDGAYYNFTRSQIIAPGVRMLPAPGHTYGNSIVIVENDGLFYMIHGDISYTDEAIYADKLSIVYDDIYLTRSTQNTIREFIRNHPTVYCSTHTPLGYENLEAKRVMDLDNPPETIWPDKSYFVLDEGTGKYWGLILMSVHLGMHISQLAARMKLKIKAAIWSIRIIFGAIGAVGIYEFISLRFADYIFGKVQFAFIDTNASAVLTTLQYLSVMVLFAYIGYMVQMLLKRNKKTADS